MKDEDKSSPSDINQVVVKKGSEIMKEDETSQNMTEEEHKGQNETTSLETKRVQEEIERKEKEQNRLRVWRVK